MATERQSMAQVSNKKVLLAGDARMAAWTAPVPFNPCINLMLSDALGVHSYRSKKESPRILAMKTKEPTRSWCCITQMLDGLQASDWLYVLITMQPTFYGNMKSF